MRIELKNVLRRWKRALEKYGKLNADQLELDLDIIDREIRACIRNDEETANKLSLCRCFIIRGEYNTENFLAITNGLLYELEKETKKKKSVGQHKRFKYETRSMFYEPIRFKDDQPLRSLDITMEDRESAYKIRRIVEKRMCQAYHRQHKDEFGKRGNLDRHLMHRATSFQLFNIGQIDDARYSKREMSSHWKKKYDPVTGQIVFKKKVGYQTYEEALQGVIKNKKEKPHEQTEWGIYVCPSCGKYHIGHQHLPANLLNKGTELMGAC